MIRHLARSVTGTTMLLAALAAFGGATATAGAAPTKPDPDEVAVLADDAFVDLDAEILALVALGAFGDDPPPELQAVHDEWQEYIAGYDRPALIDWAIDADGDGVDALSALRALGVPITPAIERASGPLTQDDLDALAAGRPMPGDPLLYVRARDQLDQLSLGNVPAPNSGVPVPDPTAAVPTGPPTAATAAPATSVAVAEVPAATPTSPTSPTSPATPTSLGATSDGRSRSSLPVLWILIAVGAVGLGAFALVASLRRGGGRPAEPVTAVGADEQFDLLSEAARRMTNALDEPEIARIALDQAMQMTRSRHGAFVTVDAAGLTATAAVGDVFAVRSLTGGMLSRVADTGQTVRRITHDEPAITSLPAALLASPVIGGGRVIAILFLVRPDSTPFTDGDETALSRLTPIVASSLAAATKHGDATALSRTDALTGLANRRTLDEDLATLPPFPAPGRAHGVVMVDVDHFKHFNDRNGHAAGDTALRAVADALRAGVRPGDRVYRYGGEEFSVLLPNVDRSEADQVAERVRALVEHIQVPGSADQPGGALTISVGVALVSGTDPETALRLADRALYDAKTAGRNRVVVAELVS